MISKEEILERARVLSLEPSVVEKDYALGWLLHAIGRHAELSDRWVFKGGTCLKKVHFETYRFSEDLDFTLRDAAHLELAFLDRVFRVTLPVPALPALRLSRQPLGRDASRPAHRPVSGRPESPVPAGVDGTCRYRTC
jgi:hypothetical protein